MTSVAVPMDAIGWLHDMLLQNSPATLIVLLPAALFLMIFIRGISR